jgi:hypothetical protein
VFTSRIANSKDLAGSETADIVYNDQQSTLFDLLMHQGYLDALIWTGSRPVYYVEVKATTSTLEVPFFVSQNQFDRMESMKLVENRPATEVYMVIRVFNIGHSGMGLKLYLDPATLRADGVL